VARDRGAEVHQGRSGDEVNIDVASAHIFVNEGQFDEVAPPGRKCVEVDQ
jgi:hypothetical protein